jgi:endonuclease/exonuclease/phosphatase (EEP) superfamily protein YafD
MGANSFEVVAAHALVPVGVGHQLTFDRLAHHLADHPEAVLIGDLNASPWSREYSSLLRQAEMRDARRGQWPHATWHSAGWAPVRLPIDHALTRGRVEVLDFQLGPDIGSDHRPLVVDLKVENRAKADRGENRDGH